MISRDVRGFVPAWLLTTLTSGSATAIVPSKGPLEPQHGGNQHV